MAHQSAFFTVALLMEKRLICTLLYRRVQSFCVTRKRINILAAAPEMDVYMNLYQRKRLRKDNDDQVNSNLCSLGGWGFTTGHEPLCPVMDRIQHVERAGRGSHVRVAATKLARSEGQETQFWSENIVYQQKKKPTVYLKACDTGCAGLWEAQYGGLEHPRLLRPYLKHLWRELRLRGLMFLSVCLVSRNSGFFREFREFTSHLSWARLNATRIQPLLWFVVIANAGR